MGLFKIFTRKSSKARLKGNVTSPPLGPSSQENGDTRQPDTDIPAISITSQQEPDLPPQTADLQDQSEAWDSTSAPAPFVPRHPSLVVEDRPRTAASIRSLSRDWPQFPSRPKREPRKPPVSFKKPSSLSSVSNAYQNTTHTGESDNDINSLVRLRRTNGSRSSLGSIKSKDILDAQEEIRPTDFRSRVHAAGARDYGEDVADRNITRHRDGNLSPTPDPRQMSNRTKSLSSTSVFPRMPANRDFSRPSLGPPLKEESASQPLEVHSFSSRNKRRLSLNTYVPTGMVSPVSSTSVATSPALAGNVEARDFASPDARPGEDTTTRSKNLSPTTNNFSRPRSPQNFQVTTARGNISPSHMAHVADGRIAEVLSTDDIISSEVPSTQRASNQSLGHASPPRSPARQSYQTLRSSLASSIPSRYPSTDLTPLGYPNARLIEAHVDPNTAYGETDTTVGRPQSSFSHRHSRSNDSEDQIRYHRSQSLGFLSSPLEADEQSTIQSGSIRNWSLSETSRSDTTGHSNVFSAASGRPHSRHTANTSLDSKSAESFMTANNGQHGSDWSPVTNRSKNFNIDDYVSSDDDSFTTPEKKTRPTAEGEEDLLFKPGYGILGVALPGLEALGEEDEYSGIPTQDNRNDSVSSNDSAAVASSPKDTRLRVGTNNELSPTLRHVRSDPEELYMSTFGRLLMQGLQRPSTANVWEPEEEHQDQAEHLDGSYTPSSSSTDSDEPGARRSTVGSLGGFRPGQRSGSSFSVYSTGGTVTTTITGGAKAVDHRDTYDDMRASRRGLKRLSALGTLYGRSMSSSFGSSDRRRPTTASDGALREEMKASDIIRRRKEDKTRKRSDGGGLKSIRERRLTEAFGRPGNDGIAMLKDHLRDDDELWDSGR
ncbi:hypothetical protein KVR01_002405 [Diaporthe batatas]|uniref:uncharacterized protein n=1 Tax=Diaporthe batatas TaxID=748121 RepID=UPI001D039E52|nr:uncharacterized protein KVR01_002405 [Diaporthe batatas]KAG8166716.1 hypothetical protein KVR01_002405 [Diaporthe batatas]